MVGEAEVLKEHIGVLHGYLTAHDQPEVQAELQDSVIDALEAMGELLHQIDLAQDLHKLGGMGPLIALALPATVHDEVRHEALSTLAICAQNNAVVQEQLMQE